MNFSTTGIGESENNPHTYADSTPSKRPTIGRGPGGDRGAGVAAEGEADGKMGTVRNPARLEDGHNGEGLEINQLRPIGSTFWQEGQDLYSIDSRRFRILYEIVNHVRVSRYSGDKEGVMAEELQPRKIEYWDATGRWWK